MLPSYSNYSYADLRWGGHRLRDSSCCGAGCADRLCRAASTGLRRRRGSSNDTVRAAWGRDSKLTLRARGQRATRLFPGTLVCQYMLGPCVCSTVLCRTTRTASQSLAAGSTLTTKARWTAESICTALYTLALALCLAAAQARCRGASSQAGAATRNTAPGRLYKDAVLASIFKEHQPHRRRHGCTGL